MNTIEKPPIIPLLFPWMLVVGLLFAQHLDWKEQTRVLHEVKMEKEMLIGKIHNLEGWEENLTQINIRYMDLMDEFGCGKITFVESKECMQKYKPQ